MLGKARAASPEDIAYVRADVTRHPAAWWDGRPFDGCTCDLALMDIDDLAGALASIATVLRPGGWFVASVARPTCCGGAAAGDHDGSRPALPTQPAVNHDISVTSS